MRVLDVAPTPFLAAVLGGAQAVDYLSIDIESPLAMRRMDVTSLELPDESFDVIVCSHVLEHIPDDSAAMRELRRVLRPHGVALLQTPWDRRLAETDEDPSITDPAARTRRFGQADHVRMYGRDLFGRLAAAGWTVELVDPVEVFGADAVRRYVLNASDPIIVGRRAGGTGPPP